MFRGKNYDFEIHCLHMKIEDENIMLRTEINKLRTAIEAIKLNQQQPEKIEMIEEQYPNDDMTQPIEDYLNEKYKESGIKFVVHGLMLHASKNGAEVNTAMQPPMNGLTEKYMEHLHNCYINPISQHIETQICKNCDKKCEGILYWHKHQESADAPINITGHSYYCGDECAQEYSVKTGIKFRPTI